MSNFHLHSLVAEQELGWNWDGKAFFRIRTGDWDRQEPVDPAPAYGHDNYLAGQMLMLSAKTFPIDRDVTMYLLDRETTDRTNGCTHIGNKYYSGLPKDKNDEYPWDATIVLYGKRIPPHPAMTRYLVAHEYGHVVKKYISWMRGEKEADDKLYKEYGEVREMEQVKSYGPGTWHKAVSELFANDFRMLVTGVEKEYWPHPGFKRPEELDKVQLWWTHAKELAHKENENEKDVVGSVPAAELRNS